MYPVSQRYLDTIARPHTQLAYVDVLKDGNLIATSFGGTLVDPQTGAVAQPISGNITVDKTSIRRAGNLTFTDVSGQLVPQDVDSLFAPFSTEVRVWVGVRYWDSPLAVITDPTTNVTTLQVDTEFVPLVTLVVTKVAADYPQLTVSGFDRMQLLGTFPSPYAVASGTEVTQALLNLLSANLPSGRISTNLPTGAEQTTGDLLWDVQTPVADAAHDIAQSAALQLFVDPMGTFTATNEPSTNDAPVLTYQPGQFSMMQRPKREISAEEMYNAVVFTGEPTDGTAPVRGYAQDDDPGSLTYVGRTGVRIYFASSPIIRTAAAANAAAKTTLLRILGLTDSLNVAVMPNHALECGDVIYLKDPQQGIDFPVLIDSFSPSLRASDGWMLLTCRNRVIS
jgi:hypothetical protein